MAAVMRVPSIVTTTSNIGDYIMSNNNGIAVRRIRTPHSHDVLCGRGGGINGHVGNRVFRDWVAERRLDYNLAKTKVEKTRVAKEVLVRVKSQSPPGRFLMRDSSGGIGCWWVEIDEIKAMAKTSQALREGAPSIRAQHKEELKTSPFTSKKRNRPIDTPQPPQTSPDLVPSPLMSNARFQQEYSERPGKKQRMDDQPKAVVTPTLCSTQDSQEVPPLALETTSQVVPLSPEPTMPLKDLRSTFELDRSHDGFVNPFLEENNDFGTTCLACGSFVPHGKDCTCMSCFDPLHDILSL